MEQIIQQQVHRSLSKSQRTNIRLSTTLIVKLTFYYISLNSHSYSSKLRVSLRSRLSAGRRKPFFSRYDTILSRRNVAPCCFSSGVKDGQKILPRLPTTSDLVISLLDCQSLSMIKLCNLAHVVRINFDIANDVSCGLRMILHFTENCQNACSIRILN